MAYTTFARGLLERDRFIFTLLLAIEVGLDTIMWKGSIYIYLLEIE